MVEDSRTDLKVWGVLAVANLIASLLAIPYTRELLAQAAGFRFALTAPAHVALALVNAAALAFPAAALGLRLGRSVGLGAPLLAAGFERRLARGEVRRALLPGAFVGVALGAFILAGNLVLGSGLERELARFGRSVPEHPSAIAGVLGSFGAGIGEETLLRLFLLTALYRLFLRFAARAPVEPRDVTRDEPPDEPPARRIAYGAANMTAALVFGVLHFGNATALGLPLGPLTVTTVLVFNGAVGIACGELYRRHGIESAMVAHTGADLVIHGVAPAVGWA